MSASDKKKLRREQNAAAMTERQKKELKEAKKLKTYTLSFVVVMVLVLAIFVGLFVRTPIAGAINRGTHAANIGTNALSTVDLTYFYVDAISNHYSTYYNQYGDSAYLYAQIMEGVNFTQSLSQQTKDEETKQTWADYYIEEALKNAQQTYALYEKALADKDFKLDEADQDYLDELEDYMKATASYSGASSVSAYLRSRYCAGANMDNYRKYTEVSLIASEYYNAHRDSLEYKDEDYRTYEKDKMKEYSSYTYAVYEITASKYLTGGTVTKDENGKETTTYSDAEKQASVDAAKKDAEALTVATNNSVAVLNTAIQALPINKDVKDAKATEYTDYLYDRISNEDIRKWLTDDARKAGDITFIEKSTTTKGEDGKEVKTVTGYTVILSTEQNENLMKLQNVRHILVKFKGGTTDSNTGTTTYTEAEKATAKASAQALLDQYLAGEKTEAAFEKLAKEKTEDTGSKANGGLYEDIYPGQMVQTFNDWCFDSTRQPGDTGLVETEYGYHVMYYVSADEMTYRDYMIDIDMTNEAMEKWIEDLAKQLTIEKIKLTGINQDYTLLMGV